MTMKPELTQDLKERFFAMYWGQKVMYWIPKFDAVYVKPVLGQVESTYLLLRPISSLSDDEAVEVARIVKPHVEWIHDAKYGKSFVKDLNFTQCVFPIHSHAADYLRSIGVALPFLGHSVEELIAAGWIKLTD